MIWLFVVDPLEKLKWASDTSLAMAEGASRRGHEVFICTLDDLHMSIALGSSASVCRLSRIEPRAGGVEAETPQERPLTDFDRVVMRKDPPFNMEYIYATYVLGAAESAGVTVINGPQGLRDCNEKLYPMRFPDLCPPTIVSRNPEVLISFLAQCGGQAVLKPLDLMGGREIFFLDEHDPNLASLVSMASRDGNQRLMCQAFIQEAREGDKRILLVDGEVFGVFVRTPKQGDFRGNLSQGAIASQGTVTPEDQKIVDRIAADLMARGQRFVGIDIIGPYLTEVNVTSPMGLRELDDLYGIESSDTLIEALER
jgi:glutathione synthase